MELSAILAFLFVFALIVLILAGIAYYGMNESKYESATTSTGIDGTKRSAASKVDGKKSKSATSAADVAKKQMIKKRKNSSSDRQSSEEIEEEPIVIIPDPFTNQVSSRFGGAGLVAKRSVHESQSQSQSSTERKKSNENRASPAVVPQQQQQPPVTILQQAQMEQKPKPKATVKPSQSVNVRDSDEETKQPKLIKVNLVNAKTMPTSELVAAGYESQINELNGRLKEAKEALADRNKRLDALAKTTDELKADLHKYQMVSKHANNELDTLKQTNQVIQKELTKWTQKCATLEKEKALLDDKYRLDLENFKSEQKQNYGAVAESTWNSSQTIQNLEAQIAFLQNELTQANSRLNVII